MPPLFFTSKLIGLVLHPHIFSLYFRYLRCVYVRLCLAPLRAKPPGDTTTLFRLTANQSRLRSIPLPGLTSFILVCFALAVAPAQAKISAEKAEIGFGGTYVAGGWTPLRIVFENAPDPKNPFDKSVNFTGQVVVLVQDGDGNTLRYTRPLELPVQSRKLVELNLQVPEYASTIKYELISEKGRKAFKGVLVAAAGQQNGSKLRREIMITPTVLLLTGPLETPSFPSWLSASAGRTAMNLKMVEPAELPSDYKAYEAVRLLVVRGRLSGALTSDQLAAIRTWIDFGGRLAVVTPRNHAEIQRDPWLEDLLPAAVDSVHEISMAWIAEGAPTAPILMTRWGPLRPDSSVYWDTSAGPVALRRRVGLGEVYALGLDPSSLGTDAMNGPLGDGLRTLHESMVLAPALEDVRARHHWSSADIDPSFTSVMLLPNRAVVVLLITLFVLVVGPLNFFILRKRRQLEMAWLTIPALSLGFFFMIYIYGLFAKGGDQHVASSSVLHLGSGGSSGLVLSNIIQFSPRKATYSFVPTETGIAMPIMNYYKNPAQGYNYGSYYGNPRWGRRGRGGMAGASASDPTVATVLFQSASSAILRQPVQQWRMAFYQGEAPVEIDGSINGYVTLSPPIDGDVFPQVRLTLENDTDAILANAMLYVGELARMAGSIEPRSSFDANLVPGKALVRQSEAVGEPVLEEDDGFHKSAFKQFKSLEYPHSKMHRPQRRCRLVARQNLWTTGLDILPAPEFQKNCAFVEVDLPLKLEGDVKLSTKDFLRAEAYAYDSAGVTLRDPYTGSANFCTLNDASLEFLLSPPKLAGPVQFVDGEVVVKISSQGGTVLESVKISAFDYSTASWSEITLKYAVGSTQSAPINSISEVRKIQISPDWINPVEPMVRFKLEGKNKQGSQTNYRRGGLSVDSIEGFLEFRGASSRPIVTPLAAESSKTKNNPFASNSGT